MRRYNFLPDSIIQARHNSNIKIHLVFGALSIVVLAVLGSSAIFIRSSTLDSQITQQQQLLTSAKQADTQVLALKNEIAALKDEDLKLSVLSRTLPTQAIISLIVSKMPQNVAVSSLKWSVPELKERKKQDPKTAKKRAKSTKTQNVKHPSADLNITGLADSDVDVANFINSLSNHHLLSHVSLVVSKEVEVNEKKLYQFVIKAEVPTNRQFHIANAAE